MVDKDDTLEDEFRERIQHAEDAILELLEMSTPESWIDLRGGLAEIKRNRALGDLARRHDDQKRKREEAARAREEEKAAGDGWRKARDEDLAELHRREAHWRASPIERREAILLEALGDEGRTRREIADKMNELVGGNVGIHPVLRPSSLQTLLPRMLDSGQLVREKEVFQNKPRWRYFRARGLDGPIADLDRAYRDDREVA